MLTRLLSVCGLYLGEDDALIGPAADNPEGFYEHREFHAIDEDILELFGGAWDHPPVLPQEWLRDPRLDSIRARAKALTATFDGKEPWGWKDPRSSLVLPFWHELIPNLKIIVAVRAPTDVFASLSKRGYGSAQRSLSLWTTYSRVVASTLDGIPCRYTHYSSYFSAPREELKRICEFCDLRPTEDQLQAALATISGELKHSDSSILELLTPEVPNETIVRYLEDTLRCGPNAVLIDREKIGAEFKSQREILAQRNFEKLLRSQEEEYKKWVDHLTRERDEAHQKLRILQQQVSVHLDQLQEVSSEQNELKTLVHHLEHELDSMRRSSAWRVGFRLSRIASKFVPPGSAQRKALGKALHGVRRGGTARAALSGAGIDLRLSSQPQASIIVPVHNHADYTLGCLRSLSEVLAPDVPYEAIVLDDGSSDQTSSLLESMPGIRYLRNDDPQGFIRACNRAASEAQGKYLVFLNNDTEVRPGWLEWLVNTAKRDENVGAVGSMLLFPDGTIQEAGGVIFNDATGTNFGRGKPDDSPECNYVREVDYCSGASLLVRADLFRELGGFSEEYLPAYYEDTDLCFSIREKGFKVLYQPKSKVVHYEGVTSGTDLASGVKRYQGLNKHKFFAKWRSVLEERHYEPAHHAPYFASRRLAGKPIVLFTDHRVPLWDVDSGSVRLKAILEAAVQLGYGVIMLPTCGERSEPYCSELQQRGIEVLYHSSTKSVYEEMDARLPLIDIAFLSRPQVGYHIHGPILDNMGFKVIYDTVDVHFVRMKRQELAGESTEWRKMRDLELRLARAADATVVVTPEDKATLEAEGISNLWILPNIHDVHDPGSKGFSERRGILFIGGYAFAPNVDAAKWLINEIMPRVWSKVPDLPVTLLGSEPPDEVCALRSDKVTVTGHVKDVDPYFRDARVFVAPLRFGAGMKGKIGQSLSFGLPTITTTVGAEGFGLEHENNALIADSAEALAEAVVRLYTDEALWKKLAANGPKVLAPFSFEVVKNQLRDLIDDLCEKSRQRDAQT